MKETNNKKRSWKRLVTILSCVVVFCTTYALILPAVAQSKTYYCGKEEHTHSEECYRSSEPLCGKEEAEASEGHTHSEECYELVENKSLICGQEESELHVHDDSCYQVEQVQNLICGKEESEPVEGHTHSDDCYKSEELLCKKEEHTHSRECESNKEDVEDPNDWQESYKDINQEEDAKKRILTVAKNELNYKENEANFEIDEDGKEHYYTRYGHFYEDKYGDWNNYFTGFVLNYANVQMNFDKDISKWQVKTVNDQNKEVGKEGNVVFFRDDEGELRSGILVEFNELKNDVKIIQGDVDNRVQEVNVKKEKVIAYLDDEVEIIEEDTPLAGGEEEKKEENKITQTSKDAEETVEVTAEYTKDAEIPDDAEFRVVKLEDSENGNPRFDIGFFVNEVEIEPKAEVSISIKYLNEKLDGTEIVDYIHYKKDGSTEKISSDVKALEDGSVETKFTTDSFSVYEADITVGVKKVDVEGADGEVEIGTEVTLTANPKGYKEGEKLYYQWQYNPVALDVQNQNKEYQEKEEDWYDIKGENKKEYKFVVDGVNASSLFRVKVDIEKIKTDDREYVKKENTGTNGVSEGKAMKLSLKNELKLPFLNIKEESAKDDNANDESDKKESVDKESKTLSISESTELSTYIVSKSPAAIPRNNEFTGDSLKEIPHTKTIDYLSNNTIYNQDSGFGSQAATPEDAYRLYLDIGPTAGSKPLDLIVVIDVSGSMKNDSRMDNVKDTLKGTEEKWSGGYDNEWRCNYFASQAGKGACVAYTSNNEQTKYRYKISGTTGLIESFLSLNDENRIAFATFSSEDYKSVSNNRNVVSSWYSTDKQVSDAKKFVDAISPEGGTNYMLGLKKADELLTASQKDKPVHERHVIFLTDGQPTFSYTNEDYRVNSEEVYDYDRSGTSGRELHHTAESIKIFHTNFPDVSVSTVGYGVVNAYLPLLQKTDTSKDLPSITADSVITVRENNTWKTYPKKVESIVGLAFNKGTFTNISSSSNVEQAAATLATQMELIGKGPRTYDLELKDVLSPYVEFDSQEVNILLKAQPKDETQQPYTIFNYSGTISELSAGSDGTLSVSNNGDVVSYIPNGDKSGDRKNINEHWVSDTLKASVMSPTITISKTNETPDRYDTITLKFNPKWQLDPTYKYVLSFNVRVSQEAYDYYDTHNSHYPENHVGSAGSDFKAINYYPGNNQYEDNSTSVGNPGFFTNMIGENYNTAASLKYKYDSETEYYDTNKLEGEYKVFPFNRPVVQIYPKKVGLLKTDEKNNPLSGATFELYQKDAGTVAIKGTLAQGKLLQTVTSSNKANNKGKIDFGNLNSGTYYLIETSAPKGYNLPSKTYKLVITTNGVKYNQVEIVKDNDGKEIEQDCQPITEVSNLTDGRFEITIKNTPGSELPNTGGTGTKLFTFSGGAIIAASSLMYGYKKRQKGKKKGGIQ